MSQKVSAEVFGKLSRLKSGDAIHFKANVEGNIIDCVIVILSGQASGEMVLSECSTTLSHITDGNGKWVLCSNYGLVTADESVISWIQETIRVETSGGLKEAQKYQSLNSKMSSMIKDIEELEKELRSGKSSLPIYAHQFCSDMEVAHEGYPFTTTSMAAWMVEHLPQLPKSVQIVAIGMIMSNFCNGDWGKQEKPILGSQKPQTKNLNQPDSKRTLQ